MGSGCMGAATAEDPKRQQKGQPFVKGKGGKGKGKSGKGKGKDLEQRWNIDDGENEDRKTDQLNLPSLTTDADDSNMEGAEEGDDDVPGDDQTEQSRIPPFFAEILTELETYVDKLGGLQHFKQKPFIERKVNGRDFSTTYSDYEYLYLTILGFAFLHSNAEEIVLKNNGQVFTRNPGVQMLERVCGITMHAGRDGSDGNHLLRSAPAILVEAFQLSRADPRPGSCLHFFTHAFDRTGGPCLEGRYGLLTKYLEKQKRSGDPQAMSTPPWEDVTLQAIPKGAMASAVLGEHLRVFVGECTWKWSQVRNITYEQAKTLRFSEDASYSDDFARYFNSSTFEETMIARRVAAETVLEQWESATKSGEWLPYQPDVSDKISRARTQGSPNIRLKLGPRAWNYTIDFTSMMQINDCTGGTRLVRCIERPLELRDGRVTLGELKRVIQEFIELATLPEAPKSTEVTHVSDLPYNDPVAVEETVVGAIDDDTQKCQAEDEKPNLQ